MQLDSVRALKAQIAEDIIRPVVEENQALSRFSVSAMKIRKMTTAQPAIALGIAEGSRKKDYRLAVRLQRRVLEEDDALRERIAELSRGEADVRYVGRITKRAKPWHQSRCRPLLIGCSVAHHAITAGTLGAFVLHNKSWRLVMLSNNHVLADEDNAKVGDVILQPGRYDLGKQRGDACGRLLDFVKLKSQGNLIDAAIASIDANLEFDAVTLTGIGKLADLRADSLEPGEIVHKVGRTTNARQGDRDRGR